jgi:hypothetical protein
MRETRYEIDPIEIEGGPLALDPTYISLGWDGGEVAASIDMKYIFSDWRTHVLPIEGMMCIPSGFKEMWPEFINSTGSESYQNWKMGKWKNFNVIGAQNWNPKYYIELLRIFYLSPWPNQIIIPTDASTDTWGCVCYSPASFDIGSHDSILKSDDKSMLKRYLCIQAFHSFLGFPFRWSPDQNIYMKFVTTKKGSLASIEFGMCYAPSKMPDKLYLKLKGWLKLVYERLSGSNNFTSELHHALLARWEDWIN